LTIAVGKIRKTVSHVLQIQNATRDDAKSEAKNQKDAKISKQHSTGKLDSEFSFFRLISWP
jgi:hypothetical protein